MPERDHIVEAIRTYCRAETEKDKSAFLALFADNVVHEDPVGITRREGLAGVTELYEMATNSNVDLRLTADVIVRGNEAMALMESQTGPDDARRRTGPIVDHFVFDDAGKIVSVRAFYNF